MTMAALHDDQTPIFHIADANRFRLDPAFLAPYRDRRPAWGVIGEITYLRTYSRFIESENRNERFWETCRRVVEGAFSILKQHQRNNHLRFDDAEGQRKAQDMFERMFAFKFLPPGRGLFFMGTRALELKGAAACNNCGFCSTKDIDVDFSDPFVTLMDFSMLGVGMGFDVRGAGKVVIQSPIYDPVHPHVVGDSREGWVEAVRVVLDAFVGKNRLPTVFDYSKVRREGALLRTFGGTASGPQPLMELIETIKAILLANVGRPVSKTVIVDIANYIGKCVVAGNVRRSSEIALDDAPDAEFLGLKDPARLVNLYAIQAKIASAIEGYAELETEIHALDEKLSQLDVLDPQYAELTVQKNAWRAAQKDLCHADPAWQLAQERIDEHPLISRRWASNNTVLVSTDEMFDAYADATVANGEPGYGFMDTIREYGRLADPPNGFDRKAMGFNPCSEQSLWDRELCCLVESFPTNHDSLDDWKATLKMAYLYAKIVTLVPTHRPATNAVMIRNRRIGTSMAGVFEMYEKHGMQECVRWWDAGYKHIVELDAEYSGWMGIAQSIKHTSIKPGGCRPWYALTTTDQGIFTLEELFHDHPESSQWAPFERDVSAEQGDGNKSRLIKTYANGRAPVYRVTLSYGLELESTGNHQWYVSAREDRSSANRYPRVDDWVRTDHLHEGDIIEVRLGTYEKSASSPLARLDRLSIKMRNDADAIRQPTHMNPDLAWVLGYLWGDGSQSPQQYRIRFFDGGTANLEKVSRVIREQFGVDSALRQRTEGGRKDYVLEIGSKMLWHWLIRNNVWKYFGDNIDVIPEAVRTSSREDVLAFLAGLLDADGCASLSTSGGKAIWTTADRAFASHVQHVAWSVGLGLGKSVQTHGQSFQGEREMYHLTLGTRVDPAAFNTLLRHSTKLPRLTQDPRFTGWNWDKEDVRGLTVGKVLKIEQIGEMDTYDVEVEGTHWFYAGAVKSHNTVPLLPGKEGGMKLPNSRWYFRTIRVAHNHPIVKAHEEAGYRVEDDLTTPRTKVIYFPVSLDAYDPERKMRTAKDVTLWEQLEICAALQAHWADNMVSSTITFQPHEAKDVKHALRAFARRLKAVSFLPLSDHKYAQAPYIECTEAQYVAYKARLKPVRDLYAAGETSHDVDEKFCDGAACEVSAA
jgi:ribonucleoside-triphosphate reductase